jgi:exodeoxyribonuclease VII large subunit
LLRQRLGAGLPDPAGARRRIHDLERRLRQAQAYRLASLERRLAAAGNQLRALGPQQTLARGYAIARDQQGRIVRDAASLGIGQTLDLSLADGAATVSVDDVAPGRPLA